MQKLTYKPSDDVLICVFAATAYGYGVYFAKDASYSDTYSQPGPHGERCMYLAKVLVGKYTAGKQGMLRPPPIEPNKPEILYDSLVNDKDNPTIFVIFNDFHCYPEYIITFKRTSIWSLSKGVFEGRPSIGSEAFSHETGRLSYKLLGDF